MDFQLTADQVQIKEATRKLCAGRFPIDVLRGYENTGFPRAMWDELAAAGSFSLTLPEERGGAGLGVADAAVVLEEFGRGLVPGPLVWSHLASGLGGDRFRPGSIVGGVERPAGAEGRPAAPVIVEHLPALDALIVVDESGVWHVDPAGLTGRQLPALDPLTPVWEVPEIPAGEQVAGPEVAARWAVEGAALVAAQLAGMCGALVDLTVAYTRERHQFGRPVGSFQALKHLMADMAVRAELARVQAYAAAVHLDDGDPGAGRAARSAKVVAGHAALRNATDSIQAHGGMGYTWEVDSHLYLKRAWVLDSLFGSADEHAAEIAGGLP